MNRNRIALVVAGIGLITATYFVFIRNNEQATDDGTALAEVTVPALEGKALAGEQLFEANCAQCHGKNGQGRDGNGPPLIHRIYEPNHHGDASFHLAVQQGVRQHHWRFGSMPPIEGVGEEEVAKIIVYVRALQRANGIN